MQIINAKYYIFKYKVICVKQIKNLYYTKAKFTKFEKKMNTKFSEFEKKMDTQFTEFKDDVYSKVERVRLETQARQYDMQNIMLAGRGLSKSGYVSTSLAAGRSPRRKLNSFDTFGALDIFD